MGATIDEVRLLVKGDVQDAKNKLKNLKAQGKDTADSLGKNFSKAFKLIAASAAILKGKALLEGAINQAVRLQKALQGVAATARLAGEDVADTKKKVLELSADGQIGVDKLADAMKLLLGQGFSLDKAFKVLDAAKKVGVLENAVGNAGEAVVSFTKFLATGSAMLAENLSPALISTIKELGGYAAVSKDVKAKMGLVNAVIKRGADLNQDYQASLKSLAGTTAQLAQESDLLAAAIGEALADPVVLEFLSNLLKGIREFLTSLKGSTKTVAIFTAVVLILGAAFAAAFGPMAILAAAVVASISLIANAVKLWRSESESLSSQLAKEGATTAKLIKTTAELQKVQNKTAAQTKQLAIAENQLRDAADKLNVSLFDQKGRLLDVAKAQQVVIEGRKKQLAGEIAATRARLRPLEIQKGVRRPSGELVPFFDKLIKKDIKKLQDEIDFALKQMAAGVAGAGARAIKLQADFDISNLGRIAKQRGILDQLEADLAALSAPARKVKDDFGPTGDGKKKKKEAAQQERFETLATFDLRQNQLEKLRKLELDAIDERLAKEEKAINTAFKLGKDRAEELERVRGNAQKKRLEADIKSFTAQRANIESTISQVTTAEGLQAAIGGTLKGKGFGGLAKGLGFAGAIPGAIANLKGLFSGITGFFNDIADLFGTSSEELREQEEQRQEVIRATIRLREQEVEIQKKLIALNSERDRLLGIVANRQIQLNEIEIANDEQRRLANLQVRKDLETQQRASFGLGDLSASAIADRITESEKTTIGDKAVLALIGSAASQFVTEEGQVLGISESTFNSLTQKINSALSQDVSPDIRAFGNETLTLLKDAFNFNKISKVVVQGGTTGGLFGIGTDLLTAQLGSTGTPTAAGLLAKQSAALELKGKFSALAGKTGLSVAQSGRLLAGADELFNLLAQIATEERGISGASKTLELDPGRKTSFIDASRLGRFSIGKFLQSAQPTALGFSQTISGAIATTERAKGNQEIIADNTEVMKNELKRIRVLMAAVLQKIGSASATNPPFAEELLLLTKAEIAQNAIPLSDAA